jgi:plastocyanin
VADLRRFALALAAAVALVACGGGESAAPPPDTGVAAGPGEATGDTVAVTIKDFSFEPSTVKVKVGQKVVFTNEDGVVHTATADEGAFDSGDLQKGKSFTFTADKPGTFSYFCTPHQYMKGTIEVT